MSDFDCASCDDHVCSDGVDCYDAAERVKQLYENADDKEMRLVRTAAAIESMGYMRWPRAWEIIRFAKEAGFKHLGIAFCIGMQEEARAYAEVLELDFEVSSVCCKVCGIPKADYGLRQLDPDRAEESMCSPLGQAQLLNEAGCDMNIVMGLCVGHDALFTAHCKAPVTTLIAKDRVLGHNPVAAIYSRYWRKQLDKWRDGK